MAMNKRTTYHFYKENVGNDKSKENHAPVHENIFCHCFTRKVKWMDQWWDFISQKSINDSYYAPT